MDLHLGATEAEPPRTRLDLLRQRDSLQQASVELRGENVAEHDRRAHLVAVDGSHAVCAAVLDENALDVAIRLEHAAVVANQLRERIHETRATAARHRHPTELDRGRDHLRHEARGRSVRPEAGVQHPGSEQTVCALGAERLRQPVAGRLKELACEGSRAAPPEPPVRLQREPSAGARPQLRTEDPERQISVGHELGQHPAPGVAVARCVPVKLGGVPVGARRQERRLSVREEGRGRVLGVQVLEAALGKLVAQFGVRRAADPQRMPGAEHVVQEAGLAELRRLDRAAGLLLRLEHADPPPAAREERRCREGVDAATDDCDVEVSHPRASGTRRR